ncbi:MAG: DNA polymerase I [Chitinispirillia bacterium]|jgi:DNA polymerase-1
MSEKQIYLIDGHALAYRAYFAFLQNPLSNSKGQPTGAVFGFANYLIRILQEFKCQNIMVAFDSPKPSFRKEIYKEYKANRKKMDDDLISQIPLIFQLVECFNIPYLMKDGLEADDIIACITQKARCKGYRVYLISKDKDLMQLVSENVQMLIPETGGKFTVFGPEEVKKKMGVPPGQILDLLSLMGDSSDNIPGIPGVGPKTAVKILSQVKSTDILLKDISVIKNQKLKQKIEDNIENLNISKKLATLKFDIDIEIDIENFRSKPINRNECISFFKEMEFTSLLKTLLKSPTFESYAKTEFNVHIPADMAELTGIADKIHKQGYLSIDTETTSLEPHSALLVGISFSLSDKEAFYIPVGHNSGKNLPVNETLSILKPVIESKKIKKIGQNLKYDYQIFKKYGITLNGISFDTMIAAYIIDPGKRQYNMDALALQWLNIKTISIESLIGKGKNQKSFAAVSVDEAASYAGEDAIIPLKLRDVLYPILKERNLIDLFQNIEIPLIPVLAEMEWTGVEIDKSLLNMLSGKYNKKLDEISNEIYTLAGEEFNLNSPKQISEILFSKLKLPKSKKIKTGFSTDVIALEKLAVEYEIAGKLLEYRETQKLLSTYIDAIPIQVNSNSGRVHTSFNQTIAATGRLSSTGPNLQNIPIRTDSGKRIREAFIVPEGYVMVSADYSQIELRILAHYSDDESLIQAFKENRDIHTHTASVIYNVFPEMVTGQMRRAAKTINFGLIYGMGPHKLSNQLKIPFTEAQIFIKTYFEQFPTIHNYIDETVESARKNGYVETLLGRRRYLPDINSGNYRIREAAERVAVNTPVQGTAADIIKIAMVQINNEIGFAFEKAHMLLQVHDELIFEVPEKNVHEFVEWVACKMSNAYQMKIPLKVDTGIGKNWSLAH